MNLPYQLLPMARVKHVSYRTEQAEVQARWREVARTTLRAAELQFSRRGRLLSC
jgi:hypothetical protein